MLSEGKLGSFGEANPGKVKKVGDREGPVEGSEGESGMSSEGNLGCFGEAKPGNGKGKKVWDWKGLMEGAVGDLGCFLKENWEALERSVLEIGR